MALGGSRVDAVVVSGTGAGALRKLNADGIRVYRSVEATIKKSRSKENRLPEVTPDPTCGGHQGNCSHH